LSETPRLNFKVDLQFDTPTSNVWSPTCYTSSPVSVALSFFLILVISVGVVVFYFGYNFISPMTNKLEHLFMCLLVIYVLLFVKSTFKPFAHFQKNRLLVLLSCKYIENIFLKCPLSDFVNIFFCLFLAIYHFSECLLMSRNFKFN
jgi:hypothetical protein